MTDSQDSRSATDLSPRETALLAQSSPSRGYVPKSNDVEPEQAPVGAASPSTPVPDDDQSDHELEFRTGDV